MIHLHIGTRLRCGAVSLATNWIRRRDGALALAAPALPVAAMIAGLQRAGVPIADT